jgi:aryl-alcohol dehydrogenase-like predicted oxidoreductase
MTDRPARLPTRALGSTGMEVTPIGFGAWAVGGPGWDYGWGAQDDAESIAAIHRALELGVNWIDTAAVYGFGHSEVVVGRALEGCSTRPYVFTKASLVRGSGGTPVSCLRRDSIRSEAETSLTRLGVDAIDLLQIHHPLPEEDLEEGWSAFVELREEGLVRHVGVSNFSVEQIQRISGIAPVETLQPHFSLIEREAEGELLPYCEREGIGVIAYSPMGSGLLSGSMTRERIMRLPKEDWRHEAEPFREPALSENLEIADRVARVARHHNVKAGAVAIAWALRNPAVSGAIVGFRRPEQVDQLIAAVELRLNDSDVEKLLGNTTSG